MGEKKVNLDLWWSSLTVTQKERIAGKAVQKAGGDPSSVRYPACTAWWSGIEEEKKAWIHDHCVDSHGYLLKEWQDGTPYGD